MLMPYFINNKTKRVIFAKSREEARYIYGLTHTQLEQEVNLFVPSEDKDAVIPQELATAIGEFKREWSEHFHD